MTRRRASTSSGRQQSPKEKYRSDGEGCPCMMHPVLLVRLRDAARAGAGLVAYYTPQPFSTVTTPLALSSGISTPPTVFVSRVRMRYFPAAVPPRSASRALP